MPDTPKIAPGEADMPMPRRVSTASSTGPPSASTLSSATSKGNEELVETLYSHPSVRIIAFTSTQRNPFTPRLSSVDEDRPGTLPASSQIERTLAVGPFRIYRAPGSVAFLSCGSALQPILPKSQCWCIDEDNSRFVLQIRRPQYWRIELPVSEPDDKERALLLRDVFDRILLFEKTHCPFQRSFIVELPEEPDTPIKKKAWTPEGKNLIATPFSPISSPTPKSLYHQDRRGSLLGDGAIPQFDFEVHECHHIQRAWHDETHQEAGSEQPTEFEAIDYHARYRRAIEMAQDSPDIVQYPAGLSRVDSRWNNGLASSSGSNSAGGSESTSTHRHNVGDNSLTITGHEQGTMCVICAQANAKHMSVEEAKRLLGLENRGVDPTLVQAARIVLRIGWQTTKEAFPDDVSTGSRDARKEEEYVHSEIGDEPPLFEGSGRVGPMNLSRKRMTRMLAGRAFTAPPHLTVVNSPPSKSKQLPGPTQSNPPPPSQPQTSGDNSGGSTDSFHSVQSWHPPINPLPPSPPSSRPVTPSGPQFPHPHEAVTVPPQSSREKGNPAYTTTPDTDRTFGGSASAQDHTDEAVSPLSRPSAGILEHNANPVPVNESSKASQSTAIEERERPRPRPRPNSLSMSRRALSPLPSAANFFSPPPRQTQQSRMAAVRRIPGAIIQKTVEVFLRPPTYLVNLMLRVAARIAAGEWRGLIFGFGESGEKIPVQWDYSDGEFSDWTDDEEYTTALQSNSSSTNNISKTVSRRQHRDWEVD
ncbi:inheritance of peroxisomes protein 1-domain-containing protein [Hypoxylon trugodes]|uniref:inheritance of peroxisomes protein 1-domain-containing protein n=1 Tax=Hypoxylon trugodes TaxID=326681 RepID=UPI002196E284|nr:inheritance of peroxisomes protein 1-domain-containing protein [Hypoxylon trugodes]KAI1385308.1 inheritance of peroxisomes protein 1-domain-containing protein [Hypoxylon trugodes]